MASRAEHGAVTDRVLKVLARGGDAGVTAGDIARALTGVARSSIDSAIRRMNTGPERLVENGARGRWRATARGAALASIGAAAAPGPQPGAARAVERAGAQGVRARVWRALRIRAMTLDEIMSSADDGSVPNARRRAYDYLSALRGFGIVGFNRGAWVLVRDLGPDAPTVGVRCFDPNAGRFIERLAAGSPGGAT